MPENTLTVAKLIEALKKLPQDLPVFSEADWAWVGGAEVNVEPLYSAIPEPYVVLTEA